jgi:hypothetical protein
MHLNKINLFPNHEQNFQWDAEDNIQLTSYMIFFTEKRAATDSVCSWNLG